MAEFLLTSDLRHTTEQAELCCTDDSGLVKCRQVPTSEDAPLKDFYKLVKEKGYKQEHSDSFTEGIPKNCLFRADRHGLFQLDRDGTQNRCGFHENKLLDFVEDIEFAMNTEAHTLYCDKRIENKKASNRAEVSRNLPRVKNTIFETTIKDNTLRGAAAHAGRKYIPFENYSVITSERPCSGIFDSAECNIFQVDDSKAQFALSMKIGDDVCPLIDKCIEADPFNSNVVEEPDTPFSMAHCKECHAKKKQGT